jgi:hypothetical protein
MVAVNALDRRSDAISSADGGAVFLVLLSSAALAQATWDALQRFGLTGAFSASCKDPPAVGNPWVYFSLDANGVVGRKLNSGTATFMAVIDGAELVNPTTLKMKLRNDDPRWQAANGVVFDLILVRENNSIRTRQSTGNDGVEYVKDGIVKSTGKPSPTIEKCQS